MNAVALRAIREQSEPQGEADCGRQ